MTKTSEVAYLELIDFLVGACDPEELINFRPSAEAHEYLYELIDREREGKLSAEEAEELNRYMALDHIVRMLKAKARLRLAETH